MSMEWNGFSTLQQKLENLERKASNEIVDKALDKGSEVLLNGQKETVPIDTGNLLASLGTFDKRGSGANKKIDIGIAHNQDRSVTYGYYQNYGTTEMTGSGWIQRAWNMKIGEASAKIKEVIKESLKF
ncbi:HK97-gp10 family putative phage morphogenesis protein [Clostridioides sp. ZZV14-6387]|uniref:HK97-gp10 family putative phage morphogenesis protein n=1 Tax=Clostridioides sp. ZZV14-6387 TaxID=2811497 RepID=UPI001D12FA35|nr:HK97 gp10 family phage protein [Clostridioides sp. ZZV14-6387]